MCELGNFETKYNSIFVEVVPIVLLLKESPFDLKWGE